MDLATVELLACPVCRGGLTLDSEIVEGGDVREGRLTCNMCHSRYDISNGVVRMLPPLPEDERWEQWEHKQALGLAEYENPHPESKPELDLLAAKFGAFCQLTGTILDVGCGIERMPAYAIRPAESKYLGVDPLIGEHERAFDFVQGLGEWLPFRAASFDRVVCATSLDHFPNPSRVMSEIQRVLKPSGRLGLWVGVLNPEYLREVYKRPYKFRDIADRARRELLVRVRERGVLELLKLAWRYLLVHPVRSAVGRARMRLDEAGVVESVFAERSEYHFNFFKAEDVAELVTRSGYTIVKRCLITDREHGDSLFLLAAPNQEE
jgi:SAM-dependent methyltransferase